MLMDDSNHNGLHSVPFPNHVLSCKPANVNNIAKIIIIVLVCEIWLGALNLAAAVVTCATIGSLLGLLITLKESQTKFCY